MSDCTGVLFLVIKSIFTLYEPPAVNPVTWSALLKNYEIDPESLSGYPALKSFNVGIVAVFK